MNYITLNGKKSTNVHGLIIQSLPPISKPQMRVEIEEIDGRDGDIVTPLGFQAYDRDVLIGLYGNYNIDEVIEYFNSEGTVIFSNEPYKYYNYKIVNQIDFERLVKFKTATVTFHVQPYKYSTIEQEKTFTIDRNLFKVPNNTMTSNGVTLSVLNGQLSVSGTASKATEFYLPITALTLMAGNYTLNAFTNGTGAGATSIRLIKAVPSNADSFGGGYVTLSNGETVSMTDDIESPTTYNYLWFYITAGTAMDYTFNVEVVSNDAQTISIQNTGNIYSKPVITIHGVGTINLSLNGTQILVINLGDEEQITIDVARMEASKDGILKNRLVVGNYDNCILKMGTNTISWTGDVSEIDIDMYSRWI